MASDEFSYEIAMDGKPTGVRELPIERILDDAPYLGTRMGPYPSRLLSINLSRRFAVA